ncbi:MAG: hypothetical protein HQL40_15120, partial [Alphaproteobacteria bacterium]|nr:hypothetical protein [Alphaproteobacteria bacterium]
MKMPFALLVLFVLGGCQLTASGNTSFRQTDKVAEAESLIKDGKHKAAYDILSAYALDLDTAGKRTRELIASHQIMKDGYPNFIKLDMESSTNVAKSIRLQKSIRDLLSKNVITQGDSSMLEEHGNRIVLEKLKTGVIAFDVTDDTSPFASLSSKDAQEIIFVNSVEKLKSEHQASALVTIVFGEAVKAGSKSSKWSLVQKSLPDMKLTPSQVQSIVYPVFPDYARRFMAENPDAARERGGKQHAVASVRLVIEPEDRLFYEDLVA